MDTNERPLSNGVWEHRSNGLLKRQSVDAGLLQFGKAAASLLDPITPVLQYSVTPRPFIRVNSCVFAVNHFGAELSSGVSKSMYLKL